MSGYNVPPNVQVHYLTFDDLKKLVAPHLDFDFVLDKPYKLCDYKPMYGLIFQNWLKGYDFWGYVDHDIIWRNIGKFVSDEILDRYDRIYRHGHFQLYRNTENLRRFILHKLPDWNISYRDMYSTSTVMAFDEIGFTLKLFNQCCEGRGAIMSLILQVYFLLISSLCAQEGLYHLSDGTKERCMGLLLKGIRTITLSTCTHMFKQGA